MLGVLRISPVLEILDEVPESQWQFWEREYIRVFKAIGMDLVNTTEGGDGVTQTPEIRKKIGTALKGKSFTPSHLAAVQAAGHRRLGIPPPNKGKRMPKKQKDFLRGLTGENHPQFGRKRSLETKARMSAAQKGHEVSEEARANMSKAHQGPAYHGTNHPMFGVPRSEETKAKLRIAHTGRKESKETKARKSEAMKASWARRKDARA